MGGRVYHDIENSQQVSYVTIGLILRSVRECQRGVRYFVRTVRCGGSEARARGVR